LNPLRGIHTNMAKHGLPIALLLFIVCGCAHAQCVPGGLAVIVNKANPVESLSMAQLRKLILGDVRAWSNSKNVALIARDPNSKDFQCMLSGIVRLSPAEYHRYIISAEFRGDEPMVIQTVDSDAAAGKYVGATAGGLAVVEANSVPAMGTSVKVIHIEGKTLGQPGYPL
jgi:ABC-type phosphate transport system substrate-binding protein